MSELEQAWHWREERGVLAESDAIRIFHGPGEASGALQHFAVDRFVDRSEDGRAHEHFWITRWEKERTRGSEQALGAILDFLKTRGASSAVELSRPEAGVPEEPQALFGSPPTGRFAVSEPGGRFWIQLLGARHPGLFLDHAPLRQWLRARARGWRVLNTFSYTGSLSVSAGLGHADQVTTLDLAKPAIQWAENNWRLNDLSADRGRFIAGDVFEWMPRLRKEGLLFDCVILDPPSFSRGKKGSFSTSKDLAKLHSIAMDLLAPGGFLVTSINSAQVPHARYLSDIQSAAAERKLRFSVHHSIDLPETFPTRLSSPQDRYLKGWILRRMA